MCSRVGVAEDAVTLLEGRLHTLGGIDEGHNSCIYLDEDLPQVSAAEENLLAMRKEDV